MTVAESERRTQKQSAVSADSHAMIVFVLKVGVTYSDLGQFAR